MSGKGLFHTVKLKKIFEDVACLDSTVQPLRALILGLRRLRSIFSQILTSPSRSSDAGIGEILARFFFNQKEIIDFVR